MEWRKRMSRWRHLGLGISLILLFSLIATLSCGQDLTDSTGSEIWAWQERHYVSNGEPKDLLGFRVQAYTGIKRIGLLFRLDVSGMPGSFNPQDIATYRDAEITIAAHWNLFVQQGVRCGAGFAAGYAVMLESQNGVYPTTASLMTWAPVFRCSGHGVTAYVGAGQDQALIGFAVMSGVQIRQTKHTAWNVRASIGEIRNGIQQNRISIGFAGLFGGEDKKEKKDE
jgi:hypothetical protein